MEIKYWKFSRYTKLNWILRNLSYSVQNMNLMNLKKSSPDCQRKNDLEFAGRILFDPSINWNIFLYEVTTLSYETREYCIQSYYLLHVSLNHSSRFDLRILFSKYLKNVSFVFLLDDSRWELTSFVRLFDNISRLDLLISKDSVNIERLNLFPSKAILKFPIHLKDPQNDFLSNGKCWCSMML